MSDSVTLSVRNDAVVELKPSWCESALIADSLSESRRRGLREAFLMLANALEDPPEPARYVETCGFRIGVREDGGLQMRTLGFDACFFLDEGKLDLGLES